MIKDRTIGYAPCWPFRVVWIENRKEWVEDTNWLVSGFWLYFISPFWDGTVKIRKNK